MDAVTLASLAQAAGVDVDGELTAIKSETIQLLKEIIQNPALLLPGLITSLQQRRTDGAKETVII